MAWSSYQLASKSLAKKIINQDTELMANMYQKNIQTEEMYGIFRQRLLLFEKALTMPFTETDRLLLNSRQAEIRMELKLFRLKQHVEDELSQINSRLCELEAQLSTLKQKDGNIVILEPIDTKVGT
jgi:hypothetical protein